MRKYFALLVIICSLCIICCNNQKSSNELNEKEMITKDITFYPDSVCCKQMDISVVNDTVRSVIFTKGCAGNTQGVARLIAGLPIDSAISRLEGICCGDKNTSCPDQLSKALKSMK
jgi:uncharacterized protein (TIGR03905 family)